MLTSMKKLKSAIPSLLISLTLIVSFNAFADNLFNCKQGYISCNKALLSGSESEAVKQSDLSRNLYNCKMGYIGCNRNLLTESEAEAVKQSDLSRNLYNCKMGYIGCNRNLLNESEAEAVKQSDLSRNLYNCKMGYIGCNQSLLSDAEKQQFQQKQNTQNTTYSGACAENGSCYGDISDVTGLPKTTHVNGYYRRDGTYVRGHYRSRR